MSVMQAMYKILAILQVRNFQALDEFERRASVIMSEHGGRIASVFETRRNADGSGEEVHVVEFPDVERYENYRLDDRHGELKALRERAVSCTEIKVCLSEKSYL